MEHPRSIPRQLQDGQGGRGAPREPGRHEGHSALINLCPPAPGEAAGAAARSPLPSLYKHLLTPLLSAIDCRLVDTLRLM